MTVTDARDLSMQAALDRWKFMTQDAEWEPKDAVGLLGRRVCGADLNDRTWELRLELQEGGVVTIWPGESPGVGERRSAEGPPFWEVITPAGSLVEFGPGFRWQVSDAGAPAPG